MNWTNEEIEKMYKLEQQGKTDAEIGAILGRKAECVQVHRSKLRKRGIYKGYKNKTDWTAEDDDILRESVGTFKLETIAKKLNRTVCAVYARMDKLGICNTKAMSGMLTTVQIADAIGTDSKTVWTWCMSGLLKYCNKKLTIEASCIFIDAIDFWKFAKKNKQRINFKRIKRKVILPEPAWLDDAIKNETKTIKHKKAWTNDEDKQLMKLFNMNLSYTEIAKLMNRNRSSIEHRLLRLSVTRKLHKKWTDKEVQMLVDMHNRGLSDIGIAYKLGREVTHIIDKRRRIVRDGLFEIKNKIKVNYMRNKLIRLFSEQLGIDKELIESELDDKTTMKEIIHLFDIDSIDQLELTLVIEDEYSIEITDDEAFQLLDMNIQQLQDFIKQKR